MMKKLLTAIAAIALAATGVVPAFAAQEVDKSDTMVHVDQFKYPGGTELASDGGKYLYSSELNGTTDRGQDPKKGGLHIFDTSGGKLKEVGFLHCPGTDNDSEFIRPGLVAMAFSGNVCAPVAGEGLMLIDVKNPHKPRMISFLNTNAGHTIKPFPGGKYIYMAGGNLAGSADRAGTVIVDVSNPLKPKIAARIPANQVMDCHDVSFSTAGETPLGFCSGAVGSGEVQIWDVSDPLNPTIISRIVNPAIQYSHYAVASTDGQLLAIDDEAFAAHDCNSGASPTGRVWFYDISDPSLPLVQGSFAPPRGGNATYANIGTYPGWTTAWCLSHGLDWQPNSHNLAVTWFTGGVSVIDANDPTAPTEAAYFQAEDSTTYSTLWHKGFLFTNDMQRGVDMFKVKGLK